MQLGKMPESHLCRSVLRAIENRTPELVVAPDVGVDAALIKPTAGAANGMLVAEACVTLPLHEPVRLAVIKAINNLAVAGGVPLGVTVSCVIPEDSKEQDIKRLTAETERTLKAYTHVSVLGGTTQLSAGVTCPIVSVNAVGYKRTGGDKEQETQKALRTIEADMDIIMTKWTAMEATALLAENCREALATRFPESYLALARAFGEHLSVLPEAAVLSEMGIAAMHDISSGGVFAGLYELLEPSGLGCHVRVRDIPIKQETIELCEFYNVNPYMVAGGGSLLAVVADGEMVTEKLCAEGIPAFIIGKTTTDKKRAVCIEHLEEEAEDASKPRRRRQDENRFLVPPKGDELYHILSKEMREPICEQRY